MREICLSGSTSGNRKQNQAKPDCGGAAKAKPHIHRETTVTAPVLDSTPHYTHLPSKRRTDGASLFKRLIMSIRNWLTLARGALCTRLSQ